MDALSRTRPTTHAEYYSVLPVKGELKLTYDISLAHMLAEMGEVTRDAKRAKTKETENWEHYAFHSAVEIACKGEQVQHWINEWIERVQKAERNNPKLRSLPKDTHALASYLNRKPDVAFYRASRPQTAENIVLVGEMKCRQERQEFSDEDKGQLLDFLFDLLVVQPCREGENGVSFALGFLCDSHVIQFFRLSQNKGCNPHLQREESEVLFVRGIGGATLLGLLMSTPDLCGFFAPEVSPIPAFFLIASV